MLSKVNQQFDEGRKRFQNIKRPATLVRVVFNPRFNKLFERYLTEENKSTRKRLLKRLISFRYRYYLEWQSR